MKKYFSILFLSVYLLSITQLGELIKLPLMAEHYMEHKQQNSNLTFWGFLCLHYEVQDVVDADHEKDMKLPFKSYTSICSVVFCPLTQEYQELPKILYTHTKENLKNYSFSYCSTFLSSIWQPPRNC